MARRATQRRRTSAILGVQGLSGGVGASVLTAALGVRGARRGTALIVDTDPWGAGADVLAGMEREAGWRWPDLELLRGEPDVDALLAELPSRDGLSVLGWGRRPHRSGPDRPWHIVARLSERFDVTYIDLPGPGGDRALDWWSTCDRSVLVSGASLDQCVAAEATAGLVPRAAGIVLRTAGRIRVPVDKRAVSQMMRLPVLCRIEDDDRIGPALTRGEPVGSTGVLATRADELTAALQRNRR